MRKPSPCKYCDKRTATCHSICKEYIEWKADLDNDNQIAHDEKSKEKVYQDYKIKVISKTKKGERR